jgi:AraC-like DNA-binding protein
LKLKTTPTGQTVQSDGIEILDQGALPPAYGRSRFERIALDSGGVAVMSRIIPANDLSIMVEPAEKDRIISSVLLKGSAALTLKDEETIMPEADTGYAFRYQNNPAKFSLKAGTEVLTFGISLPTNLYAQYLGDEIPDAVRCWIDQASSEHHLKTFSAPNELRAIFMGAETAALVGPLRRAYFEGAALMYASLVANEIAKQDGDHLSSEIAHLTRHEIDAVQAAYEELKRNLGNPPTLSQLARGVGLTEKRINHAFKAQFGTTVFEALRKERLEHAKRLLEETDLVPKEIAWASGYRHVSNFSNAFRRQFGCSPAKYKNHLKN